MIQAFNDIRKSLEPFPGKPRKAEKINYWLFPLSDIVEKLLTVSHGASDFELSKKCSQNTNTLLK